MSLRRARTHVKALPDNGDQTSQNAMTVGGGYSDHLMHPSEVPSEAIQPREHLVYFTRDSSHFLLIFSSLSCLAETALHIQLYILLLFT